LAAALSRDAAYVGLVASPTRAGVVRGWLRDEAGIPVERLAALRAPAGLDLGAETAEEVALSILAELVQVRRGTASFVAAPGPATLAGGAVEVPQLEPVIDDIVLLDPVCGMTVDRRNVRHLAEHDGVVYAFCSMGCRTRFIKEPAAFLATPGTHSMEASWSSRAQSTSRRRATASGRSSPTRPRSPRAARASSRSTWSTKPTTRRSR